MQVGTVLASGDGSLLHTILGAEVSLHDNAIGDGSLLHALYASRGCKKGRFLLAYHFWC